MGKLEGHKTAADEAAKSRLVSDICSASDRAAACSHAVRRGPARVDWYRLLGVEENAELDAIRKQYHKLALQLHPDKNHHPKAEHAFKLVSEAYSCLSDDAKRNAFNLERWRNLCYDCQRIRHTSSASSKLTDGSKAQRTFTGFRDIRERFKEEARVIESCLRAAAALKQETIHISSNTTCASKTHLGNARRESPVFDPSLYKADGYPHLRTRTHKMPGNFRCSSQRERNKSAELGSPIFMGKKTSAGEGMRSRSVCLRS
ncbi:chaperone protein DnaJ-like [Rhodamnia argentea]|uniref:Chaperone protein DnaJ-like n=1 Tax=Rhodamnia argentea TaxID=178133 RepID=A0A8B8P2S7_9MYRT|nr:chaperone protein DnaJ-like [Rhodamnia argentea]